MKNRLRLHLLTIILLCTCTAALSRISITNGNITASPDSFETQPPEEFYKNFGRNIVACSPGIDDMMTAYEFRKSNEGLYKKTISYDVGKENHPFIAALYFAFAKHHSIRITPDMIWLIICQSAATHINLHSSEYRNHFTKQLSKKRLTVRQDDLTSAFSETNWTAVVQKFSDTLSKYVDTSLFPLFNPSFSTTGLAQKAAFQLTLMNAVKDYYEYYVVTACGIPEIIIEGERADWVWMYDHIDQFNVLDLQWWTKEVKPVLQEFINAFDGDIDKEFWCSILKQKSSSGSPLLVNGWIKDLFPYVLDDKKKFIRNKYLGVVDTFEMPEEFNSDETRRKYYRWLSEGLKVAAFSTGLQVTPFTWDNRDKKYRMIFYSGFLGIQFRDGILEPKVGYLIGKK